VGVKKVRRGPPVMQRVEVVGLVEIEVGGALEMRFR